MREGIRQLINSIPRVDSQYTIAPSSSKYIERDKSLPDLPIPSRFVYPGGVGFTQGLC